MKPVTLLVVGGGGRGAGYAEYSADHPDELKIVGVAEPLDFRRNNLASKYAIPPQNVYTDWRQAAGRERFADAVVIATQDAMHAEPAVAFAERGYHMLLEKPLAPNEQDCRRIIKAVLNARILFAVAHVLRYTVYTRRIKQIIDSGVIGDVVSIQHLEPVGYWHQAHSFVRGAWRNSAESSFMLLAKSCHDIDWIRHIMGRSCRSVASFGSLYYFRPERSPAGAAERCLDCTVEPNCPYSAKKIYLGLLARGKTGWPLKSLADEVTPESVMSALRDGPFGRCVYRCDNDVVDNQVVIMNFEGGRSASFTMTAFTPSSDRKTRIFGTLGHLEGDGRYIHHFDFLSDRKETIDTKVQSDGTMLSGHGGGDFHLMKSFVSAVAGNDQSQILSGPVETLESHLIVFAAERSRMGGKIVEVDVLPDRPVDKQKF